MESVLFNTMNNSGLLGADSGSICVLLSAGRVPEVRGASGSHIGTHCCARVHNPHAGVCPFWYAFLNALKTKSCHDCKFAFDGVGRGCRYGNRGCRYGNFPDSKAHGADIGPNRVLSAADGSHVGPMNLAIWVTVPKATTKLESWIGFQGYVYCLCDWNENGTQNVTAFLTVH